MDSGSALACDWLETLLRRTRNFLGMELACVLSLQDQAVLRVEYRDGTLSGGHVERGSELIWDGSVCQQVTGDGFAAIPDMSLDPRTRDLDPRHTVGAQSYVGIPIVFGDGTLYGFLCCASAASERRFTPDAAKIMQFVSNLTAEHLEGRLVDALDRDRERTSIQKLIDQGGPKIVFQGVFELSTGRLDGFEALSRFPAGWGAPNVCFTRAFRLGLGIELELAAVRNALEAREMCGSQDLALGVNVSPATFVHPRLHALLAEVGSAHLVVELTEHERIDSYESMRRARAALREQGVVVALDDAGAGYAGLRHLVELQPDLIKLDRSIVANIHRDDARRSVARAMAAFARDRDIVALVEGVETVEELLCCVNDLDVALAQGFYLHRPELPYPDITVDLMNLNTDIHFPAAMNGVAPQHVASVR